MKICDSYVLACSSIYRQLSCVHACNGDLCQVAQYCSYTDTLVSDMRTSITSGSELAYARLGTDSCRLNQESGLLEFGNCLHRIAVVCFTSGINYS